MPKKRPAKSSESQRHELTAEDRRRGAQRATEVKRAKREAAEQLALERLTDKIERAVEAVGDALEAERLIFCAEGATFTTEDHRTRLRAARELLDRVIGRPRQAVEHTGTVGFTWADLVQLADDDSDDA